MDAVCFGTKAGLMFYPLNIHKDLPYRVKFHLDISFQINYLTCILALQFFI